MARVLSSEVFNSEGNKSSIKSLRDDFNSKQYVLLTSFKSSADLESEYLTFSCSIALFIDLMSEFVISEISFLDIGLPLRYKTASILVIRSTIVNSFVVGLD